MFTDIKNIAPCQTVDLSKTLRNCDSKEKFNKLFKPLLRVLRNVRKSNNESFFRPNNVNLNNYTDVNFIAPTMEITLEQTDFTATTYEYYTTVFRKATKDEEFLKNYIARNQLNSTTPNSPDCSDSNLNLGLGCGCSHGYNCQRNHKEFKKTNSFVPVHYVKTNNGTFFWTSEQTMFDQDVEERVYYNSFQQSAQAQWDNRL